MASYWHNSLLGKYSPEDRWVGLDFEKLFLDPQAARLTHRHELTHSVLSRSTNYGQATEVILQLLPKLKLFSKEDVEMVKQLLRNSQLFTQEGTACLMELLTLRHEIGNKQALVWCQEHFTDEYYSYLNKLLFVPNTSQKYIDFFTMKIPHLALHTGIKKAIVTEDLLSDPKKLIKYLSDKDNQPDYRLNRLIGVLSSQPYLSSKAPEILCSLADIIRFDDVSKNDAADFINYARRSVGITEEISPSEIRDSAEVDFFAEANEQIIIANMNFDLANNASVLWKQEDLLHYQKETETVFLTKMDRDFEEASIIDQLTGTTLQAALYLTLKTGEKFLFGSNTKNISSLLTEELSNTSLIVKWGLYKPGDTKINGFDTPRIPNIVIYNTIADLRNNFKPWFSLGNTAEYLFVCASEKHPFQSLWIKDSSGVLHLLNTFNRPASEFISEFSNNLINAKNNDFVDDTRHFNNALSCWCGLPMQIDWYKSMKDSTPHYRNFK